MHFYPKSVNRTIKVEDNLRIIPTFFKAAVIVSLGIFSQDKYPIPLIGLSILSVSWIFYLVLHKRQYCSFIILLFICNHFPIGETIGGTFNVASLLAVLFNALVVRAESTNKQSCLNVSEKYILLAFLFVQIISVLSGNEFLMYKKLLAIFVFALVLFIFYYTTLIEISLLNFIQIIKIIGIFLIYMFLVSLNQKYLFFYSVSPIFPSLDKNIEYDMGILRSAGTMFNFEAYAEYCFSVVAILLPGILTGAFKKIKPSYHIYFCIIILIAIASIILSGTRSSLLLLPVMSFVTIILINKRLKLKILLTLLLVSISLYVLNSKLKLIDTDVIVTRSQNIDFANLSFSKIANGEEINRGEIFAYGIKKIQNSGGMFGAGYFTTRHEYTYSQFDINGYRFGDIPDYHNLYIASLVLWGSLGTFFLLYLFIASIIRGIILYRSINSNNSFLSNLLLGFTISFIFLLINEFKIQLIREPSYFVLILILLALYNSLIKYIQLQINMHPTRL